MPLIVRAFPVLDGREGAVRQLAWSMATDRAAQVSDFYARFGVRRESWHLQTTPMGLWVIAVTDIDVPLERAQEFSDSQREFDTWFKNQVLALTGVDPQVQPLGPGTEEIFAWSEE